MKIYINEVVKQALRDYRVIHGLNDKGLAKALDVTSASVSRWIHGETPSMNKKTWDRILAKMGLLEKNFEDLVMLGAETQGELENELKIEGGEKRVAETCGVSECTVTDWVCEGWPILRGDVWEKLADLLKLGEGDADDCQPFTPAELQEEEEASKKIKEGSKGAGAGKTTEEKPEGPSLRVGEKAEALVWLDAKRKTFAEACRSVTVLGRVKGTEAVQGLSGDRTPALIIQGGGDAVADGERVAIQDGDALIVGTLRFVPVLVVDGTEDEGE